jgi:tRNA pseudouridine38-40 synthase
MRLALGIEYDGTDFCGWQRLSHERSVQAEVEAALTFVAARARDVSRGPREEAV